MWSTHQVSDSFSLSSVLPSFLFFWSSSFQSSKSYFNNRLFTPHPTGENAPFRGQRTCQQTIVTASQSCLSTHSLWTPLGQLSPANLSDWVAMVMRTNFLVCNGCQTRLWCISSTTRVFESNGRAEVLRKEFPQLTKSVKQVIFVENGLLKSMCVSNGLFAILLIIECEILTSGP